MKFIQYGLIFAMLALTAGCANVRTLSAQDKANIQRVTLNPTVTINNDMYYAGPGQVLAIGFIGGLVSEAVNRGPKATIQAVMQESKISLPDIVKAEFSREMQKSAAMQVTNNPSEAQADLVLNVDMYGLAKPHMLSSTLYPIIHVTAIIKKPDGTVAWERKEVISQLNAENTTGHTIEEYLAKPEYLREGWTKVAGIASRALLAELKKQAQ